MYKEAAILLLAIIRSFYLVVFLPSSGLVAAKFDQIILARLEKLF